MADVYRCVWLYTRQKDDAVAFLSIHLRGGGEKCFAQKRNIFDSFRLVIFLLRVIITRRKKFYVARGIRRLFGGKEIAILCATR